MVSPETRRELITKKAFELYIQRGRKPGKELEDWLQAENIVDRELKEGTSQPRTEMGSDRSRSLATPMGSTTSKVGGFKRG